jgi:nicotinate-nucleotide adenylyltransferase
MDDCRVSITKKKQVGIYGGSFDPIHFGHLNLAIEVMESQRLDEVWFVPTASSPHKQERGATAADQRLKMVELAAEGVPQFHVLDLEVKRKGLSYTIDTVEELVRRSPEVQLYLILGDDNIRGFHSWHRVCDLIKLVPLIIGSRFSVTLLDEVEGARELLEAVEQGRCDTAIMEISATDVRNRLNKGFYCGHLIPEIVLDYIRIEHIYC